MTADISDFVAELREALGESAVLTAPGETERYTTDWTGRFVGRAAAVVRPKGTDEVAAVIRLCAEAGVGVVPQGGNTGLVGGGVPDADGAQVVLSLERMRTVRSIDTVADTITVEAGAVLQSVQEAAAGAGRLFPLSLAAEGSATIGGNIATNAGGTAVLRYGMMRELVIGLEVVLPDGRIWDGLRPLRKDNTGYDLKQLFIGAEGTLGVVTAAVLRLFPATPRHATALLALPDVAAATALLPALRAHGGEALTGWELFNRPALELVLDHLPGARDPFAEQHRWYGLVELAGSTGGLDERLTGALEEAAECELLLDAVVAGSPAQRTALWQLREQISEAQKLEGAALKHDVTLPIADLAGFVDAADAAIAAVLPGVRPITYGHVGDGNLHYNLSPPPPPPPTTTAPPAPDEADGADDALRDAAAALTDSIYAEVAGRGGSISAEHGLGVLKREAAASYRSEVESDLMRAVKDALDPRDLMNPGKVLPSPTARARS